LAAVLRQALTDVINMGILAQTKARAEVERAEIGAPWV
jgi:hypothetical protein